MSEPRNAGRQRSGRVEPATAWHQFAALGVVALLGLGALVQPFTWDQAVFALGAERVLAGGRLYVDYWDFKQPGIFWFFALAGRVFGMREVGIHVLELVWILALAVVIQRGSRAWLGAIASAWAPLPVCGFYYAVAGSWHLLQVEGLVGLPLALSLAAAWRAERGGRREWLAWGAAGISGGAVLLFKLALAPVLVAVWAVPAWERLQGEPAGRGRVSVAVRAGSALALGMLLPLLAALALFARQGALGLVWWTWVVYPAQVISRLHGLPLNNLASTGTWLLTAWPLPLAAAAAGAWSVLRRRDDGYGRSLLAWLAAGYIVFLVQRWSGWQYQVFLVLVPVGLLAVRGIESLARELAGRWPDPRRGSVLFVLVAGLVGYVCAGALGRTLEVVRTGSLTDPAAARELLAQRSGGAYAHFERITEFLQAPGAEPGPIFVLGNPLAYWVSGRAPAIAMPGGMSIYGAKEWALIADQLSAARPPYILLEDPMSAALSERREIARPLLEVLSNDYRPGARFGGGGWLVRIR